tara:strand:+ start:98 stop:1870 length:1773 start_codon:yes stop_codon:yes gene_type:complete
MTFSIECKNFLKSLQLLNSIIEIGAEYFILCPGGRSAPLALAAGELFKKGRINLFSCIDERSAGFHALGISAASGKCVVVITTSGTAVANLLPSAVEADMSNIKIIFITADRPLRLKDCGANQTVKQEKFLSSVCRLNLSSDLDGFHNVDDSDIDNLIKQMFKSNLLKPGPIHLNIPFEKPLCVNQENKKKMLETFEKVYINKKNKLLIKKKDNLYKTSEGLFNKLNFYEPGLIIVGPYRGSTEDLAEFNKSLEIFQNFTGWPIFADPVSGIDINLKGIVENWEMIISLKSNLSKCKQLLRLGPMSSSNELEKFLLRFNGIQFLIKENDSRNLDPTKKSIEYAYGFTSFVKYILSRESLQNFTNQRLTSFTVDLIEKGKSIKALLEKELLISKNITEISLANLVPKIWPKNYPIMLSASSPIRDWLTFSGKQILSRKCFSFRGASGIDGTLSAALGIARIMNPLLLVTGDLSFLHDINGWLNEDAKDINLKILLIDNKGGNIFNRIYENDLSKHDIEKLFQMHRNLNWVKLSESHNIPFKNISYINQLEEAFSWSLSFDKSAIIRVKTNAYDEIKQRKNILKSINKKIFI